jgi:hypothetical protein
MGMGGRELVATIITAAVEAFPISHGGGEAETGATRLPG